MATENVHKGHRQRLRERALKDGLSSFNPHQVMELLLFYAIPRQDTSEIAHELIRKFGTVLNVLNAPPEELRKVKGVGPRVAEWIKCVGKLVETYGALRGSDKPSVSNYMDVGRFCREKARKVTCPATYYLAMTPSGSMLRFDRMCDSLQWGEPEPLKRCLEGVLAAHAKCAIVIAYTDESVPKVGEYEISCAAAFGSTVHTMGAELLDVVMVGSAEIISMSRSGDYDRTAVGGYRSVLSKYYLHEGERLLEETDEETLPFYDDGL